MIDANFGRSATELSGYLAAGEVEASTLASGSAGDGCRVATRVPTRRPALEERNGSANALASYLSSILMQLPSAEQAAFLGARIREGRGQAMRAVLEDEQTTRDLAALLTDANAAGSGLAKAGSRLCGEFMASRPEVLDELLRLWSNGRPFEGVLDRLETLLTERVAPLLGLERSGATADATSALNVLEGLRAGRRCERSARAELIQSHLFLVVRIARRYAVSAPDFLDLIQEGNLGLMRAADRFDPSAGRFVPYAGFWIRAFISEAACVQRRVIRLPLNVEWSRKRLANMGARLAQVLGQQPTTKELARATKMPADAIHGMSLVPQRTLSLDAPLGPLTEDALIDFVEDTASPNPYEQLVQSERAAVVSKALNLLTPTEQIVLRARFGFEAVAEKSIQQLADELGLPGERVRQMERVGLGKLKRRCKMP
jgi:RNA polymerase primary sigma factor